MFLSFLQLKNKDCIFITLLVFKCDKLILLKLSQQQSIPSILITFEESKFDKSMLVIFLQE
jgi:hypothetical protein